MLKKVKLAEKLKFLKTITVRAGLGGKRNCITFTLLPTKQILKFGMRIRKKLTLCWRRGKGEEKIQQDIESSLTIRTWRACPPHSISCQTLHRGGIYQFPSGRFTAVTFGESTGCKIVKSHLCALQCSAQYSSNLLQQVPKVNIGM